MNKIHSSINRLILFLLTLLSSIPFCLPMPTIRAGLFSEAMVLCIGLLLIAIIAITLSKSWYINRTAVWLFAFACVIGVQMIVMPASFVSVRLWPLIGLVFTSILFTSLASWKQARQIKDVQIFESIAFGILLGGIANTLYALIQISISIIDDNNLQIFGFIGQRNNYGNYLTLSIVALCWLFNQKKIIARLFYPLLTFISIASSLSASRSIIIYFAFILSISIFILFSKKIKSDSSKFGKILLVAVAIQLSAQILTPHLMEQISLSIGSKQSAQFYSSLNSINRTVDDGYSSAKFNRLRAVESMKALVIFSQNPILGTGWDSYRKESSALQSDPRFVSNVKSNGFYSHSHNLITQILAETGIIGAFIILGGGVILIFGLLKRLYSSELLASSILLGILLIHSMFEFPLWNFEFFILFCLILWNGQPIQSIKNNLNLNITLRLTCFVCFIIGTALLVQCIIWYQLIDENQRPSWTHKISRDHVAQLTPLQQNPFLDMPITQILLSHHSKYVPIDNLSELLYKFNGYQYLSGPMYEEAILQSQAGNTQRAKELIKLTMSAYPNTVAEIESHIQQLPLDQQKILCTEVNLIIKQITIALLPLHADKNDLRTIFGEQYRTPETRCDK